MMSLEDMADAWLVCVSNTRYCVCHIYGRRGQGRRRDQQVWSEDWDCSIQGIHLPRNDLVSYHPDASCVDGVDIGVLSWSQEKCDFQGEDCFLVKGPCKACPGALYIVFSKRDNMDDVALIRDLHNS